MKKVRSYQSNREVTKDISTLLNARLVSTEIADYIIRLAIVNELGSSLEKNISDSIERYSSTNESKMRKLHKEIFW